MLTAIVTGAALVSFPAGQAGAAEAACTWQKTLWDLPEGTEAGAITSYDGSRYAVGITGEDRASGNVFAPKGTLWDNGKVVLRAAGQRPSFRAVNAAGLVVGDTIVDNRFAGVTIGHDGGVTALPADPAWSSYSAWEVNNAGDIVGWANTGTQKFLVVWPGNAPGTYRETPVPELDYTHIVDFDEQRRVVVQTGSGEGGGYVADTTTGQWHVLAAPGDGSYGTPWAIRDGRVVGTLDTAGSVAAEWDARGALVRTMPDGHTARAVGGNGTVAGYAYLEEGQRVVLWRDGVLVDQPVPSAFVLKGFSDDERTIVGHNLLKPSHYRCS